MRARSIRRTAVAFAFVSGLGSAAAFAADEPGNIIKYRQALMQANAAHLSMLAAAVKGEVSWTDEVAGHAHAVHQQSQNLARLFPPGSGKGDTEVESRALPAIWEKPDEFQEVVQAFQEESAKLADVAQSGDMAAIGQQLGALGKNACGACHENFREKR